MAFVSKATPLSSISSPQLFREKTHVLDLPVEVFDLILKLLASRDLLCCATVCSKWRDMALDVKWKEHLVDWGYLLRVLGPLEPCDDDPKEYRWVTQHPISDAIASTGWRRLNELRKKITRLRVEIHLDPDDTDYLQNIHHALEPPHHAFFPKLRELKISFHLPQPHEYDLLAGGSLRSLRVDRALPYRYDAVEVVGDAMESLALRSPMVEHIKVWASHSPFIDYGKFSKLRTLSHSGYFSVESWVNLCEGCPLLEDVRIRVAHEKLLGKEAIAIGPQMQQLPTLHILNVETIEDKVFIPYILQTTRMPQLRELTVNTLELRSAEADRLFSLLWRRSPLLTALEVHGRRLNWGGLASFRKLRDLDLYGRIGSWRTEHVERIITNLPDLRRLVIMSPQDELDVDRTKPPFTLAVLEAIAMQLQLHRLDIPLNALEIPWMSEPPTPAAKFGELVEFSFGPLHIEPSAMQPFAQYLAQLCPSAEDFESFIVHPHSTWQEMEVHVDLTREEITNKRRMESLFFDAQKERRVSDGAPGSLLKQF